MNYQMASCLILCYLHGSYLCQSSPKQKMLIHAVRAIFLFFIYVVMSVLTCVAALLRAQV